MTPLVISGEIPFTLEDRDRLIKVETRLDAIDKRFEQMDKGKLEKLIMTLRELAKAEVKLNEVLKRFNL